VSGVAKTIQERSVRQPGSRRPRRRNGLRQALLVTSAAMSLVVAAGGALGYGFLEWAQNEFEEQEIVTGPRGPLNEIDTPCDPVCTYLVLGSDSRSGLSPEEQALHGSETTVGGQRADTIMLVHIDPERDKGVVVSFPRDLWVEIPGVGFGKINSAFEEGPNKVVETIEQLTGLEINHYVGVNLAGFEQTVEALGSVRICVDRPMFDDLANLNLPRAGCYDMDGRTALAFVRARSVEGDCIPDFARIGRQQQFLRAVISQVLSPGVVFRLPSLVRSTVANLPHDDQLTIADLVVLTNELEGVGTGAVDFRAVPGTPGWEGELSVVHMDPEGEQLFRRLQEGRPLGQLGKRLQRTEVSPANVRLQVLDDASTGKAQRVHAFLEDAGFAALGVSTEVPVGVDGPAILYRPNFEDWAESVHRFLPSLRVLEAEVGIPVGSDVAVIITADYRGPGAGGGASPPPTASPTSPPGDETEC
jgi:LCP family protein required for cell wall assembly